MLSLSRITRLAEAGDHERLLLEVMRNGRPLPLTLRVRLSQPESVAAAGLGLGLARLSELTWRPTPAAQAIAGQLVALQSASGSFGSVSATIMAVAGLLDLTRQARVCVVEMESRVGADLDEAVERGLYWLCSVQAQGEDQTTNGLLAGPVETALALWRFGEHPRAREALRWREMERAFEDAAPDRDAAAVLAHAGRVETRMSEAA